MAYSVKYRLEYTSQGNYSTKIEISKKNYTGSIIDLVGSVDPVQWVYESSDNQQFANFKSSYMTIEIKETASIIADFKEIVSEDDFILKYYRNNNLLWSGYLLAEQYSENDDNNQPFIRLKFYDGISRLRIYNFNDLGLADSQTYSLTQIFTSINNLLYTNLGTTGLYFNNYLVNDFNLSANLLNVVYLHKSSFFDKDNNSYNLYDIIDKIARSFNFTYLLYKNRFCITNFEFSNNPQFINFFDNTVVSITGQKNIDNNHYWLNKSKFITYFDALKKIEVYHKLVEDPNFLSNLIFNNIVRLREYTTAPAPTITTDAITFTTYADVQRTRSEPIASRDYTDVYVNNINPIIIANNNAALSDRKYKLEFKLKFLFDYGVTDSEFDAMTNEQKFKLESDIKEIEANTDVRAFYQIKNTVGVTDYWLAGSRNGTVKSFSTFERDIEINELRGLQVNGFDELVKGLDFNLDLFVKEGTNNLYFRLYHPYVVTNTTNLSSTNTRRIQGVTTTIQGLKMAYTKNIGLEEIRHEGVTDRNIFNYNLNRDREYYYINLDELYYKYSLLSQSFSPIGKFKRKTKDYSANRAETLDIFSFLINQSLEQFTDQQQYITGTLKVTNDPEFDILSTITMNTLIFNILKFSLSDKYSTYQIDLLEIK